MAVSSGAGPHAAWISAAGGTWPIEHGTVIQRATRETSTFEVYLPMSYPGAFQAWANLASEDATVIAMARGASDTLLTGRVQKVRIDFISTTIGVSGCDNSVALHHNKSSEKWLNQTGPQIVQQLVGRVGLGYSGDGGSGLMAGRQIEQDYVKLADNVSYGYIIHKLSEFDGSRWWVDKHGVFNYRQIGTANQGGYTVNYRFPSSSSPMISDAMMLHVDYDVQAGKTITHTIKSWHPKMKQMNQGQHSVPGRIGTLSPTHHIPTLQENYAQQYAKARAQEISRHELTVSVMVVGDPTIDIGGGLTLSGTGPFDQSYEIDSITHNIGYSGYTMDILAKSKGNTGGSGGTWASPNAGEPGSVAPSGVTPGPGISGPPGSPSGPPAGT